MLLVDPDVRRKKGKILHFFQKEIRLPTAFQKSDNIEKNFQEILIFRTLDSKVPKMEKSWQVLHFSVLKMPEMSQSRSNRDLKMSPQIFRNPEKSCAHMVPPNTRVRYGVVSLPFSKGKFYKILKHFLICKKHFLKNFGKFQFLLLLPRLNTTEKHDAVWRSAKFKRC